MNDNAENILDAALLRDGLRCERMLFLKMRGHEFGVTAEPDYESRPGEDQRLREEVWRLYPGGRTPGKSRDRNRNAIDETERLIQSGADIIYDAVFEYEGITVFIDVLVRRGHSWEIIFVRGATRLKNHHIDRAAAAAWVMFHNEIEDYRAAIMHINPDCVWPDRDRLFVRVDITDLVHTRARELPGHIGRLKSVLYGDGIPDVSIGRHCNSPNPCSFSEYCRREKRLPFPSVFELPRSRELAWKFYGRGIVRLEDIPAKELNAVQKRALECYKYGQESVDRDGVRKELEKWVWPLHHLDFETISYAVPRYNGTSPHEQIPYQFSYHFQHGLNKKLQHQEYLHDISGDPRTDVAEKLAEIIPSEGSVVAYNMQFEKTCLMTLAAVAPRHAEILHNIASRLVDPLPIFRSHVYHPGFMGSFSIKYVAPALIGEELSYESLDIPNGLAAQVAYIRLVESDISDHDRIRLRRAMLTYCKQDTLAMVKLVEWLFHKAWG